MKSIVVTGACGFIASNLIRKLNLDGRRNLILVDKFGNDPVKNKNLQGIQYSLKVDRDFFLGWFERNYKDIEFVFHLGARSSTVELSESVLSYLNTNYSKSIFKICAENNIPLLYASSAATYGFGEFGFDDDHDNIKNLQPVNLYGWSKQQMDQFALSEEKTPPFWCGLKFFNVFGPYEFHKQRMGSVVLHSYRQIMTTGKMKLFQSFTPDLKDGDQMRDFIYVDDVVDVCLYFYQYQKGSGIYNVGTGEARTFNDLTKNIFKSLKLEEKIEYIPIPEDIRYKYQCFTEAKIDKLRKNGYTKDFTKMEDGIEKYIQFINDRKFTYG